MSTPIVELISADVLNTVNGLVITDVGTLNATRKIKRGRVPEHLDCLVIQEDPTKVGDDGEDEAAGWIGWNQPYVMETYIVQSEDDDTATDTMINVVRSAIEKALQVDYTRDGNAINTTTEAPELFDDIKGNFAGVRVRVNVYYRTLIDDPFEPAP